MRKSEHINSPFDIGASGRKKVLKSVKKAIGDDHLSIVAAGVAFYAFLALFPALISLISIYGPGSGSSAG